MTTTLKFFILIFAVIFLKCSFKSDTVFQDDKTFDNISDSLILVNYKYEVIKDYIEDTDSMSREHIDSILSENRINIVNSNVFYSPDNSFKIFTIEMESCGAYCNSDWKSWIHFNLKEKEKIKQIDFTTIDTIYKLPDHNYLIIDNSSRRPASVMTVYCETAHLISFSLDSIITHAIVKSKQENYFGFCQENGVNMEESPYIKYDADKKLLTYQYGNNYLYSQGLDIDTIRQGELKYINGQFVFEKENITVNNREKQDGEN
ncbi:hypothetical protein [Flavobacterium sp. J27]|uniref:hypothetical protein n=1 Tax=Flavobacterium sp. J27 TaxID=2060419 RepID=UPI001030ADC1|nr:hypothetical protein [Flavobacterium sp. J27]